LWLRPTTRLGRWAVGIAALFIVLFLVNAQVFVPVASGALAAAWQQALLPYFGVFVMLCAVLAGIIGLIAVIRQHERSWLVWLTILPLVFVLILVLGELLVPHPI
jgi:hypothetical protein